MTGPRCLTLLALACAGAAFAAGPAAGAPRPVTGYPDVLTTEHFQIHYTGELTTPPALPNPDRILHQDAGDLAASAEEAYSTYVDGWGYPAPLDDGDGKIDIWVQDLSASGALGFASPDGVGSTSTAWIAIDPTMATSKHVVAHEVLHAIQMSVWMPADFWLLEGSAEWAGFALDGYAPFGVKLADSFAAPDMSLDCTSDACGNDQYETGGYSRWTFFQYLSERFGVSFVRDVLAGGAALADPAQTGRQLLSNTLAGKATTLGDVFNDYTAVHVAGNYGAFALKGVPPAVYSSTSTGSISGALPVQRVAVNHLAARYLKLARGTAAGDCYAATLSLTVALPAGVAARPAFYSSTLGAAAVPLAVNGTTASVSVPWDTCFGGADGYLSLPNPSLTADSRVFTVSGSITVDTSTPASSTAPPTSLYTGPTVAAPGGEVAPSILVYGAELVRVPTATRVVRLIVFSSGSGLLRATIGGTVIGTGRLRAGNNDLRFRLPVRIARALSSKDRRRAATARLALTSLSTQGATGKTVTRRVSVVAPLKKSVSRR